MILFTLITFSATVILIAIVTHKMNARIPCDHDWKETEDGLRCIKCNRVITQYDRYASQEGPLSPSAQISINPNPTSVMSQHEQNLHNAREEA